MALRYELQPVSIDPTDPILQLLINGQGPLAINTDLPDIPQCIIHRIGDEIKDMVIGTDPVGGDKDTIFQNFIAPLYTIPPFPILQPYKEYYNRLMTYKQAIYNNFAPYIQEGTFTRSCISGKSICDFARLFQETGDKGEKFSSRWIPTNPNSVQRVNVAAMRTDPGSSSPGPSYVVWPPLGSSVTFDSALLERFGLPPGCSWSARTEGQNAFTYQISTPSLPIGTQHTINFGYVQNSQSIPDIVNEGNKKRMRKLFAGGSYASTPNDAARSIIYKEMGDLMQILEYFCYYNVTDDPELKKVVMVTTDEVVFIVCVSLYLPCIYTGGKSENEEGVHVSGEGAYVYYSPVGVSLADAYKNKCFVQYRDIACLIDLQIKYLTDLIRAPYPNVKFFLYSNPRKYGLVTTFRIDSLPIPKFLVFQDIINAIVASLNDLLTGLNQMHQAVINAIDAATALAAVTIAASPADAAVQAASLETAKNSYDTLSKAFLNDSKRHIPPIYIDITKQPLSVDNDAFSKIYNCLDFKLCKALSYIDKLVVPRGATTISQIQNQHRIPIWRNLNDEKYILDSTAAAAGGANNKKKTFKNIIGNKIIGSGKKSRKGNIKPKKRSLFRLFQSKYADLEPTLLYPELELLFSEWGVIIAIIKLLNNINILRLLRKIVSNNMMEYEVEVEVEVEVEDESVLPSIIANIYNIYSFNSSIGVNNTGSTCGLLSLTMDNKKKALNINTIRADILLKSILHVVKLLLGIKKKAKKTVKKWEKLIKIEENIKQNILFVKLLDGTVRYEENLRMNDYEKVLFYDVVHGTLILQKPLELQHPITFPIIWPDPIEVNVIPQTNVGLHEDEQFAIEYTENSKSISPEELLPDDFREDSNKPDSRSDEFSNHISNSGSNSDGSISGLLLASFSGHRYGSFDPYIDPELDILGSFGSVDSSNGGKQKAKKYNKTKKNYSRKST